MMKKLMSVLLAGLMVAATNALGKGACIKYFLKRKRQL